MTPFQRITAAFPGDDDLHKSVRIALHRVYFAHTSIELELPFTVDWVARMIEEPPWSVWYGPATALDLAKKLRCLAQELEKSVAALNAAQPHWKEFTDTTGANDVVSVGQIARTEPENFDDGAVPF